MKKLFLILMFLFGARLSACSCMFFPLGFDFQSSDAVARVKIISEYSTSKKGVVKYEVKVLEQYKGEPFKEFYYDTMKGTSCSSYLLKNEEMIIFVNVGRGKRYEAGPCHRIMYLSDNDEKKEIIEIFTSLKQNTLPILSDDQLAFFQEGKIEGVKSSDFQSKYAVFELEFDEDGQVKSVETKKSFGENIDEKIKEIISKSRQKKLKEVLFHHKVLLVLSYFEYENIYYLTEY